MSSSILLFSCNSPFLFSSCIFRQEEGLFLPVKKFTFLLKKLMVAGIVEGFYHHFPKDMGICLA